MKLGLNVVKFFPAGVYGGLKVMKSLSAPFGGVKFIPTGGVDAKNLKEYLEAPWVRNEWGRFLDMMQEKPENAYNTLPSRALFSLALRRK